MRDAGIPIRRNTFLLAAMAMNSATLQLVAAVSAITFVLVTGMSTLLGLGPALALMAGITGASFVLLGGFVLSDFGVSALSLGASLLALAPIAFILLLRDAPSKQPEIQVAARR